MKRILLAAALALSACTPTVPTPESTGGPISSAADTITISGTKGLILAELAYSSVNAAAQAAVQTGVLKGENARKARNLNLQITAALAGAHGAQSSIVQAAEVAKAMEAIANLKNLAQPETVQ